MTYWVCLCRNTSRLDQTRCGYCGKTQDAVRAATGKPLETVDDANAAPKGGKA